jgi:nicotinamidase-related amidase
MTNLKFDKATTALLLIDPYNDFISEGGKLWDRIKTVAEANDCVAHIVAGLVAHTCVESTVRQAVELGYDVTVVKDATADYAEEFMHAALVTNLPNYASAIVSTDEVINSISSLKSLEMTAQ